MLIGLRNPQRELTFLMDPAMMRYDGACYVNKSRQSGSTRLLTKMHPFLSALEGPGQETAEKDG